MTEQLELEYRATFERRTCHYCKGEGWRCSWCGNLPTVCRCEAGICEVDPEFADMAAPIPVPFERKKNPWWTCDPCEARGVLLVPDAFGIAEMAAPGDRVRRPAEART